LSWVREPANWFGDYVGFVPGLALSVVVALIFGRRVAHRLRVNGTIAVLLIISLGIVLAATVTPSREAALGVAQMPAGCDPSRFGPAPWSAYGHVNDTSLNVLLFVPLGALIGLLPPSPYRWPMILGAVGLPFAIEGFQLVATPLGRACQTGDVVDNLTGLFLGLSGAWTAGTLWQRVGRHA
jgi:hypothetical protein